jgi:hypothetical protein
MSFTDVLFGGSTAQHAQREMKTYDPRLGGRQKEIGDHVGDLFTWQGETLDKATESAYVQDLKDKYGNRLKELRKYNLISDEEAELTKDKSRIDLDKLIEEHAQDLKINQSLNLDMAKEGFIPDPASTYQQKLKNFNDYKNDKRTTKEKEFGGRIEVLRHNRAQADQARTDAQTLLANQNNLQMLQFENAAAERASQRRMDNRRLDLQEARDARKAQREMLMMIMGGLQNIGQGF